MKLYYDFDIESFEAWSGAKDTQQAIIDAGKVAEFNALIDDIFPEGCTETTMNDYLWFDSESIFEMLGLDEDGNEPEDEENEDENAEQTDPADYATFDDFCQDCDHCPFDKACKTQDDCRAYFEKVKGGLVYA